MKINEVEDEELFLSILVRLDAEAIDAASKKLKAEINKMKRKNG